MHFTTPGGVGGVLHLPIAIERFGTTDLISYSRVSTYGGAGPRRKKLRMAAKTLGDKVREQTGVYPIEPCYAVEHGSVLMPRKELERAAELAERGGSILVARDLSRFIRPAASYRIDYRTGRKARAELLPTEEEFDLLRKLTRGVPLATLIPPTATEPERHSHAVRLNGKHGRPRKHCSIILYAITRGIPMTTDDEPDEDQRHAALTAARAEFEAGFLSTSAGGLAQDVSDGTAWFHLTVFRRPDRRSSRALWFWRIDDHTEPPRYSVKGFTERDWAVDGL